MTQNTVQSTYVRYMPNGVLGARASMHNFDVDTKQVVSDALPFGRAVSQGDADEGVHLGLPSGRAFVGVSVRDITLPISVGDTVDQYKANQSAGIMVSGDIWVLPTEAVTPADAVHIDEDTGEFSKSGGATAENMRWMTSGDDETLTVLRVLAVKGVTGS